MKHLHGLVLFFSLQIVLSAQAQKQVLLDSLHKSSLRKPIQIVLATNTLETLQSSITLEKLRDSLANLSIIPKVHKITFPRPTHLFNSLQSLDQVQQELQYVHPEKVIKKTQAGQLPIPQLDSTLNATKQLTDKLTNKSDSAKALAKAKQVEINRLPILLASLVKSKYLPYLDSLNQSIQDAQNLSSKVDKQIPDYKEVLIQQKSSLLKQTFWEGVIGVNGNLQSITLSPALGLPLARCFTAGMGTNLLLNTQSKTNTALLGLRLFTRYELLKKKLSLQLEENGYFRRAVSLANQEGRQKTLQHLVYVGIEYLLRYSENKNINVSILYQVNKNQRVAYVYTPIVFRIGFSIFHPNHQ